MNTKTTSKLLKYSILLVGLATIPFSLITPSESSSAFLGGYSKQRIAVIGLQVVLLALTTSFWIIGTKMSKRSVVLQKMAGWITCNSHTSVIRNILLILAIFLSIIFFFFIIFVPQALSSLSAWLAYTAWIGYILYIRFVRSIPESFGKQCVSLFPSWKTLGPRQRRIALTLLFIGLIYFLVYIPVNLQYSATIKEFCVDEFVQYPVVIKMLTTQPTLRMTLNKYFLYGEYVYGFPFYGLSAILLWPVRVIYKTDFASQTQLNMVILRQLISVLPVIISVFILTYLATSFKNWWSSIGLNILVLTLPGVVWHNTQFWHPDGLNLLFISIALFYLRRDNLRFGRNFYAAAVAVGLSVATRLFGLFFFLAITGLLIAGIKRKNITIKQAVIKGGLFIILMCATILIANPYLLNPGEFRAVLNIYQRQQIQISQGVSEADPEGVYKTGLGAWLPVMTNYYGSRMTLGILGVSAIAGFWKGTRKQFDRILFAWIMAVGFFIIYMVKMKSYWYLLPAMIPFYCFLPTIPGITQAMNMVGEKGRRIKTAMYFLVSAVITSVGIYQFFLNVQWIMQSQIFT